MIWLVQPVRGKRNEPAFVTHTYDVLAEMHGQEIRAQIVENATRVFGLPDVGSTESARSEGSASPAPEREA